ncbi:Vacuolar protein sorting-associated protein 33A [Stylophora pistillata]|uniref:Vacuolar protein sorting-associated protein 33A n=1 Tax=Stylophora pistillata TaxID=50429 RepID=A0A2B4SWS0_STYPI|nr:Vacuolar protein sorting-associated protein 33A [Stylophora pistillata]
MTLPHVKEKFLFRAVKEEEILTELKKLKWKKATGLDNLPPGLLKDAAGVITKSLIFIINSSLATGVVPTEWKMAKVIPIFNFGSMAEIDNYRPILILPTMSRILEKTVHKQLIKYLEFNGFPHEHQFGYRRNRSPELAVTLFTDIIWKEADGGKATGAIFIDLSKVFDTISHSVLLEKLSGEEGKTESKKKEFTILFVPRKTLLCQRKLEELKVSFINIDEYPLELIPLDGDVLSLEMESSFKECYLENDFTSLFYVANSLMTLQTLYGTIPKIYAKGKMSKHVLDMMMRKKREAADTENQVSPQIDTLLLIDRNVDLLTPLFTQLTYEGLIDELYGIHHTTAKFPSERFPQTEEKGPGGLQQQQPSGPKKVVLNSSDELFYDIRDLNFSAVGIHLSRRAKQISAAFELCSGFSFSMDILLHQEHKSAKTVGEMKQYVQRIPFMQRAKASLATHTTIAEMIKEQTDPEEFRERIQVEQGQHLVFLDSFQFMFSSLDRLLSDLPDVALSTLNDEHIPDEQYEHAQKVLMANI